MREGKKISLKKQRRTRRVVFSLAVTLQYLALTLQYLAVTLQYQARDTKVSRV